MPSNVQEFIVFIASPSDCNDERAQVREAVEQVNAAFADHGLSFRPTGWETTMPAAGRAQGHINPMVERCDVFIGVLANQWGSPSGQDTSGFHEEFMLALSRYEADPGGVPHIALHFRNPPTEMVRDPGTELKRVLDFKREIRENFIALYSQHSTADEFGKKVLAGLHAFGLRHLRPDDPARSSKSGDSEAPAVRPKDEPIDDARLQLKTVADAASAVFVGQSDEWFDRDRMLLLAKAFAIDEELLPEHLSNRLYSRRDEYVLSRGETRAVLRTLLDDTGADGSLHDRVKPGWGHLRLPRGGELSADATNQIAEFTAETTRVARGALFVLETEARLPSYLWPRAGTTSAPRRLVGRWVAALDAAGPDLVARYVAVVAREGHRDFLHALSKEAEVSKHGDLLVALGDLASGNPSALARYALDSAVIHRDWYVPHVAAALPAMDAEDLMLAATTSWLPVGVRAAALRELAVKDGYTSAFVDELLKKDEGLWDDFFDLVTTNTKAARLVLDALDRDGSSSLSIQARDRLKARFIGDLAFADLTFDDLDYATKWDGVARRDSVAALPEAKYVLKEGAAAYEAHLRSLPLAKSHPSLVTFLPNELRSFALAVLAENASQVAPSMFAPFVNDDEVRSEARRAAVTGFLRSATFDHESEREVLRDLERFWVRTDDVLELLDGSGQAYLQAMATLDIPDLRTAALERLGARGVMSRDELTALLYSDSSPERIGAARGLVRSLSVEDLLDVVSKYRTDRNWHWYNVVALLDQAIYGPPGMRRLTGAVA